MMISSSLHGNSATTRQLYKGSWKHGTPQKATFETSKSYNIVNLPSLWMLQKNQIHTSRGLVKRYNSSNGFRYGYWTILSQGEEGVADRGRDNEVLVRPCQSTKSNPLY